MRFTIHIDEKKAAAAKEKQSPIATMLAEIGADVLRRWARLPDKCDVVSRSYFTLTALCVLHLSALVVDKCLGEKHATQNRKDDFISSLAELCVLVWFLILMTRRACLSLAASFTSLMSEHLETVGPVCRNRL